MPKKPGPKPKYPPSAGPVRTCVKQLPKVVSDYVSANPKALLALAIAWAKQREEASL